MAESATSLRHQAESAAAALPPLLVAARRVAFTVAQGVHGRRRVGQGESFWQFRPYEFGDQPQLIDWRQSAKSDRVFVREMEWEAAQSTWVWCDTSPSMDWRSTSDHPSKAERASLLTLALAVLLVRGGEHVALLGSHLRPSSGRGTLTRLAAFLERGALPDESLPPSLPLPRHAQLVLIGDFLSPLPEIEARLKDYAAKHIRGHILQILDPAEETLPYHGRVRFEGLEEESPWLLSRVETVREDYIHRLEAQLQGLRGLARSLGWGYSHHRTDRPAQAALLSLYMALSENLRR